MTRPRCGNDPRVQLTPGDRAAVANFRAFLTARAEEKTTVSDLDAARAALKPFEIISGFVGRLEAFEAAVRANERAGAEVRRLGAPDAVLTTQATDPVEAIIAALQKRAGELSELAEEQMRPSLEERAQEWLEAAEVARRAASQEPTK